MTFRSFIVEWSGKLIVNCIFQSSSVHSFEGADKNHERAPTPSTIQLE